MILGVSINNLFDHLNNYFKSNFLFPQMYICLGEDCSYSNRAFLLYDGIHYDPLVRSGGTLAASHSVFPVTDISVENEARRIAAAAHKVSISSVQFKSLLLFFTSELLIIGKNYFSGLK